MKLLYRNFYRILTQFGHLYRALVQPRFDYCSMIWGHVQLWRIFKWQATETPKPSCKSYYWRLIWNTLHSLCFGSELIYWYVWRTTLSLLWPTCKWFYIMLAIVTNINIFKHAVIGDWSAPYSSCSFVRFSPISLSQECATCFVNTFSFAPFITYHESPS